MPISNTRKDLGQFYTPPEVAETLVRWVVRDRRVRLLDPSCGDGQFLACHNKAVGIELDEQSAAAAKQRSPGSLIHVGDFFEWAARTAERFHVVVGNPPFIRYQRFLGPQRERALACAAKAGANFSGLSSSWAPFLVVAASLLRTNGRMAFLVPAEIGHATYARPLLEWLCSHFDQVRILAFREKLFPHLSEDVWSLYCSGFGGKSQVIYLNTFEEFRAHAPIPRFASRIPLSTWRENGSRLRPFLLPNHLLSLYRDLIGRPGVVRFSDIGHAGIGYVTGANDFFHLRPSEVQRLGIPEKFLRVSVRRASQLPPASVDSGTVNEWVARNEPVLFLHLRRGQNLPGSVRAYLDTEGAQQARESYKCRNRDPWYAVPDVRTPDGFLSYMSGLRAQIVRNNARCVCTNSVHGLTLKDGFSMSDLQEAWNHPLAELSCELEGHPLGGGLLKIEPGEAGRVCIPLRPPRMTNAQSESIQESLREARKWRHYE